MDLDTPPPPEASTAASQLPPSARATAAAAAMADSDPDPIVASYAVVTNPAPAAASSRKLLILQHPNKQGPLRTPYSALAEVRVKPSAGMIEVDVPLSYHDGTVYDRDKGMRWGQALSRSMAQKNGGSHGLAGGFGVGVPAPRAGRRAAKDGEESITYDWTEAVRRDQVLRTQTLGGQYAGRNAESDEECRWMIGVFKGGNLHLTPAQSEIQLRPQLHHLDAATEQERLARPGQAGAGGGAGGPGGAGGVGPQGGPTPAPKAITMTIKSSGGGSAGDQPTTETMADRLRHVQTEPWQRLRCVDENDADAWELYHQTLVYRPPTTENGDSKDAKDKGKTKETKPDDGDDELLDTEATHLRTHWGEEDLLHAVAGKDRQGVLEGYGNEPLPPGVKPGNAESKKEGGSAAAAKGKAKPAAATTARAPAKAKAPASRGTAMEID